MTLAEEFAKLEARRGFWNAEIAEAESKTLSGLADEAVTWRLRQAAQARNKADAQPTMRTRRSTMYRDNGAATTGEE